MNVGCLNFFDEVLSWIKGDAVFAPVDSKGRSQRWVAGQLLAALKALGAEGSDGSNPGLRDVFNTKWGTAGACAKRLSNAGY